MGFIKNLYLVLITILSVIGFSCEDFDGDQTIPSYIQVDTIILVDNPLIEEGALTHNFTDVWVYVDDQSIGAFELPTQQIPVLEEGNHTLELAPGIIRNGVSGTRGQYRFIELLEIKNFNFIKDSIVQVIPVVRYTDNKITFMWQENFEQGSDFISLKPTNNSDISLQIYPRENQQYGNAGAGFLTQDKPVLELSSPSTAEVGFSLPNNCEDVFVEIEYMTTIEMIVGIIIRGEGVGADPHEIVIIYPTNGVWKKMYVNITPNKSDILQAGYFFVYVRADYESSVDSSFVLMDNLKLIYNYEQEN